MREAIVEALKVHPEGLTLRDISEEVGRHRHTITKYVYELIGAQVVVERDVGAAKLCYLKESYCTPLRSGERTSGDGSKGQAQLAAIFMLLLLLPATAIVAMNATNSTLPPEGMLVGVNLTAPDGMFPNATGPGGIPEAVNGSEDANISQDAEGSPNDDEDNATAPEANLTLPVQPEENLTWSLKPNLTIPLANGTNGTDINLTLPVSNESLEIIANKTLEEENLTENLTPPDGNLSAPVPDLYIMLELPERITRGKESVLGARIENRGADAHNVSVDWMIPRYFDILEGSETADLGGIAAGASVRVELRVFARADAVLGASEVRLRAAYE